jgi:tricorn protease
LQESPFVIGTKEATQMYYLSNHDEGDAKLWKTIITPFEKNKIEKVSDEKCRASKSHDQKTPILSLPKAIYKAWKLRKIN